MGRTYARTGRVVSSLATYSQIQPTIPQVCIYPKEGAQLTGTNYGTAKTLLQRIRKELNKPARAYVSIAEFCQYAHLPEAEVTRALNRS